MAGAAAGYHAFMAYAFDALKVLVSATLLAACTDANPLFQIDTETNTSNGSSGTGSASTTSGAPTSDTPTSAGPISDGSSGGMVSSGVADTGDVTGTLTTGPVTTEPGTTEMGTSSGGMSTEGSSGSSGDAAVCGDAMIGPGEQCDEGDGINGNGQSLCTADCQGNVCGDEYVGPGEECDEGPNNGQGGECTEMCTITYCGDGYPGGDEACDQAEKNGTDTGDEICSHDCTTVVTKKLQICTPPPVQGKFFYEAKLGILGADAYCKGKCIGDYKAMIAADGRVASKAPYAGQEPGWVVKPYTAYFGPNGLVFVTGKEGLLGVVDGKDAPLLKPIGVGSVWTGLNADWTNAAKNCVNWGKLDNLNSGAIGDASMTQVGGQYINKGNPQSCDLKASIYCVQQ